MLETLKRINLAQVQEAFMQAGITPDKLNPYSCIMAAILYPKPAYMQNAINAGFTADYYVNVTLGWDGSPQRGDTLVCNLGFQDGKAAAQIMGV